MDNILALADPYDDLNQLAGMKLAGERHNYEVMVKEHDIAERWLAGDEPPADTGGDTNFLSALALLEACDGNDDVRTKSCATSCHRAFKETKRLWDNQVALGASPKEFLKEITVCPASSLCTFIPPVCLPPVCHCRRRHNSRLPSSC